MFATIRKTGRVLKSYLFIHRNPFLRSVGFEIPFIFGNKQQASQPPQEIFQRSRRLALVRCSVHILPIVISVFLICLNVFHYYLGRTISGAILDPSVNIALLQMAAKCQELLVVGSVATIVIDLLRNELVVGGGVPLGVLGGGFMFSSLSYFWSPDFIGSFHAKSSWKSKLRMYGVLIVGGLLAAGAGPASAVLIIPKDQSWDAGGTTVRLRNSEDFWWPAQINGTGEDAETSCSQQPLQEYGLCQSGGYLSLWNGRDKIEIFGTSRFIEGSTRNVSTDLVYGPRGVDVANDFSLLPGMRFSGNFRGFACETAIIGTQMVQAMYQQRLLNDWRTAVHSIPPNSGGSFSALSEYKYYSGLTATTRSKVPATRVSCTPAQNVSQNSQEVMLPLLDSSGCKTGQQSSKVFQVPDLSNSRTDHIRTTWINGSAELGTVSAVLLIESPWDYSTDSRAVIGCSIDARWADGSVITSDLRSFSSSSNLNKDFKAPARLGPILRGGPTSMGESTYSEFLPVILNPASRRIRLGTNWLYEPGRLNESSVTQYYGWSPTNFDTFLGNTSLAYKAPWDVRQQTESWNQDIPGKVNRTVALEWMVAMVVTDALSRLRSERVINTTGVVHGWDIRDYHTGPDFENRLLRGNAEIGNLNPNEASIEQRIGITIGGYSYRANSLTDYMSIALLSIHIGLATFYSIYLICRRTSSSSWDSITEMLVMMQASAPASLALRHSRFGITQMRTYSKMVQVPAQGTHTSIKNPQARDVVELTFPEPT